MKTIYTTIAGFGGNENNGKAFQTQQLQPGDEHLLAKAICYLLDGFILQSEYSFWVRKGSLTLQRLHDKSDVIKLFWDDDSLLEPSLGRSLVFGFELTGKKQEVREGWRNMIALIFGQGYIDPRVPGQSKYYLKPNPREHYYDLAVPDEFDGYTAKDPEFHGHLTRRIGLAIENEADDVEIDWTV